jgi:hypothetical protein
MPPSELSENLLSHYFRVLHRVLTSVLLQLRLVAYFAPIVFTTAGVASCGPYPDSQIAELISEEALGRVLMMKVFKAPADCPNKRTFFCRVMVNITYIHECESII